MVDGETIIVQGATPKEQATLWLQSITDEGEEVQELIMRDLVGKEDFPSA